MRTRGALASGLGVVALAGLIVGSWDGLHAWFVGYRFVWLREGAAPTQSRQSINTSGEVAVDFRLEPQGTRAGRSSLATGEELSLDVPCLGGESSRVFAINDAGDMVGTVSRDWPPLGSEQARSFLWTKDSGVTDLPTLGGEETVATAMNMRGQVVGSSSLPLNNVSQAFLWSAESGIAGLGSLAPGKNSSAYAINEAGWVVGGAAAASGSRHPFLWRPESGMQDLGLPSGFSAGQAEDINDQGEVLATFYASGIHMAFVWRERDGLVKLPGPPGFDNVRGVALNNRGTVLLRARPFNQSPGFRSYLIANGVLRELPTTPGAKYPLYSGLNDKGWLVGAVQTNEDVDSLRGFVALPVR